MKRRPSDLVLLLLTGLLFTGIRPIEATLAAQRGTPPSSGQRVSASDSATRESGAAATARNTRLLKILKESGLNFDTVSDSEWVIAYRGANGRALKVHVSVYDDVAVVQCVAFESRPLTLPEATKLLQLSFERNLAKVGLEKERIIILTEADLRVLDAPLLTRLADEVADFTDEVADALSVGAPALNETVERLSPLSGGSGDGVLQILGGHATVRYDKDQWQPRVPAKNPGYITDQFQHSSGELWLSVISERAELPLDALTAAALANAKNADPNAKITRRGERKVNGLRVMTLEIDGVISGIPFTYFGHYYSDANGSIQLVGWTAKNLMSQYRETIERFVSGFQVRR